jgi:hypothetical protein
MNVQFLVDLLRESIGEPDNLVADFLQPNYLENLAKKILSSFDIMTGEQVMSLLNDDDAANPILIMVIKKSFSQSGVVPDVVLRTYNLEKIAAYKRKTDIPKNNDFPHKCRDTASCERHKQCMYFGCIHYGEEFQK